MGRAEVIFALGSLSEAGQPAALAQCADVASVGQDLVRIHLVADIPNDLVVRRIEQVMQSHRQFDNPKAGTEMPTRYRDGIDGFRPQFVRDLLKLIGFVYTRSLGLLI